MVLVFEGSEVGVKCLQHYKGTFVLEENKTC